MCFTNLPVEFDADGNPYLAEAAEDVAHPSGSGHADYDHDEGEHDHPHYPDHPDMETVGCVDGEPGPALADLDPEEVYDTVAETLSDTALARARARIDGTDTRDRTRTASPTDGGLTDQ